MEMSQPFKQYEEESDVLVLEDQGKQLVLHNDDHNTFDWVIDSLVEICQHSSIQAEQCAYIVHYKGKCSVRKGPEDVVKPMRNALVDRGLNATLE